MVGKKDAWKALEDILNKSANAPGAFEALELKAHISDLVRASKLAGEAAIKAGVELQPPGESSHKVFEKVCQLGLKAMEGYEADLSKSPAAHDLLDYLKLAFSAYLSSPTESKIGSSKRNATLARSFLVAGRNPGLTENDNIEIVHWFSEHLQATQAKYAPDVDWEILIKDALTATYQEWYGTPFLSYEKTHCENMKVIRRVIEGHFPKYFSRGAGVY